MTRLPAAMGRESTTGTNEPSTHSSCSCASNRAKARPWSDSRTWRWTRASKEGLATAPAAPTPRATTAWNHRTGKYPPRAVTPATSHSEPVSICCSLSTRRILDTESTPSRAPAVRDPSRRPNHQVAAASRRRPKA